MSVQSTLEHMCAEPFDTPVQAELRRSDCERLAVIANALGFTPSEVIRGCILSGLADIEETDLAE